MNILFFPSWYPVIGNSLYGIFFREQALALKRAGINIYVLHLNNKGIRYFLKRLEIKIKINVYNDDGINTYRVDYINLFPMKYFPLFNLFFNAIILRKYFFYIEKNNKIKFDIVHIHSAINAGMIFKMSNIKRKYIITEHSSAYSRNIITSFEKKYLHGVFSSAKQLIVVGDGLKKEISLYTSNQIDVIFNIVSMKKYKPQKDQKKKCFRFFSLGMNIINKGMDILVVAFCESQICELAELLIAGLNQSEIDILEEIKKKYNKGNNIQLLNKLTREEVAYNMYNCDCFALTSRFETFGIVFAEAMYFGKPVIASKTGGPDSFITMETGILVPIEDINLTREALEYMFYNKEKYNEEYIKNYAWDNFSEEVITKKIINVYNNVINS
jgi:glycosyltransferase involved in cell wall biosynthesis